MIAIREKVEDSIGNAKNIVETKRIDNPLTIIGLRPILSDKDPMIGDKTI